MRRSTGVYLKPFPNARRTTRVVHLPAAGRVRTTIGHAPERRPGRREAAVADSPVLTRTNDDGSTAEPTGRSIMNREVSRVADDAPTAQ